jgi:transcriptional regulator with XRE-family HTH domain
MKRFADRLREARVAAGMTQEQLGFALGVTKSSVSAWENGRETPSFRMLPELRRQLKRSLDELICGMSPMDSQPMGMPGVFYDAADVDFESADQIDDASPVARNEKERALLLRYRTLPAKRRAALLDLIRPAD